MSDRYEDGIGPWFAWPQPEPPRRRPTVEELERLLASEEAVPIEILPNGEIRALTADERERLMTGLMCRRSPSHTAVVDMRTRRASKWN